MTNKQIWTMLESILRKADAHKVTRRRRRGSIIYDTYTDWDALVEHIRELKMALGPRAHTTKKKKAGT